MTTPESLGEEALAALISQFTDSTRQIERDANSAGQPVQREKPDLIDNMWVNAFAMTMKDRLAECRMKGKGGWQECSDLHLSQLLRAAVEKGDPIDVANYAMFLYALGKQITKQGDRDGT